MKGNTLAVYRNGKNPKRDKRLLEAGGNDTKAAIVMRAAGAGAKEAKETLEEASGSVRKAIESLKAEKA